MQLPAGPEGAGQARRALNELHRETPADALSTLELLVSEIVGNSPQHVDGRTTDWVLLEVETSAKTIRTEIVDLGVRPPSDAAEDQDLRSQWDVMFNGTIFVGASDLTFAVGRVWDLDRFPGTDVRNSYVRLGFRAGLP